VLLSLDVIFRYKAPNSSRLTSETVMLCEVFRKEQVSLLESQFRKSFARSCGLCPHRFWGGNNLHRVSWFLNPCSQVFVLISAFKPLVPKVGTVFLWSCTAFNETNLSRFCHDKGVCTCLSRHWLGIPFGNSENSV
jgi:hypothetical protein